MTFDDNIIFANKHMPAIIEILQENSMHLLKIEIAPSDKDMQEATDLVVTVKGGDVAVRVRRPGFYEKYSDFTLRAYNRGRKTEIHKIRDGFARWYLYAWAGGDNQIEYWILVDLDKLRQSGLINDPLEIIYNPGKKTGFISLGIGTLTINQCIIAVKL